MKGILSIAAASFLLLFINCGSKTKEKEFVLDRSGILDSTQRMELNKLYHEHEKKTTNQLVLLTTDRIDPDTILENYALHQFNEMGIGQKGIDNGVLIVFCKPRKEIWISTGFGTEKVMSNSITNSFIDSIMIPKFKMGEFFEGLRDGSKAIIEFLERPENKID